jgi:hypothetical protein
MMCSVWRMPDNDVFRGLGTVGGRSVHSRKVQTPDNKQTDNRFENFEARLISEHSCSDFDCGWSKLGE